MSRCGLESFAVEESICMSIGEIIVFTGYKIGLDKLT